MKLCCAARQWVGRSSVRWSSTAVAADTTKSNNAAKSNNASESSSSLPFNRIPGPARIFPFGTTWTFFPVVGFQTIKRMHRGNMEMYRRYGNIWRESVPGVMDKVSLCDPDDVATLFRAESQLPVRMGLRCFKEYREKSPYFSTVGVVTLQGKEWQQLRSKVQQPMMKPSNVLHYLPAMQTVSNDFISRILSLRSSSMEMPEDFLNEVYKWSLESIGLVALDTRLGCLDPNLSAGSEPQQLISAVSDSFECMMTLEMSIPYWTLFSTPTWNRFTKAQDTFAQIAMKHIHHSVERCNNRGPDEDKGPTVLEILLSQRGLEPADACVMALDMMMGAVDTTSHTISFTMYHLSRSPDKQEKLWQEMKKLLPEKDTEITAPMLNQMRYLKACIKESLRMTPVVMGVPRTTSQDLVLSGYKVPKGTMVMAMAQVMGRLEHLFPEAEKFEPERWLKEGRGSPGQEVVANVMLEASSAGGGTSHPFAYLPFGNGSRMCIGRRFAEQEMWLLLAKLVRNFRMEYHHEDMDCITSLVNIPDQPLKFTLIDR